MSEGWKQSIAGTVVAAMFGLLGWISLELRSLRAGVKALDATVDARLEKLDERLDKVGQSVAVLLERTAPLAPVAAKKR